MYPSSIQKLIDLFSKFPTVGPRTATRFVFYLMKLKKEELEEITKSISELNEKTKLCSFCFNPTETGEVCEICSDKKRDQSLLCVVEKEGDLAQIEKTKKYKGLYFILGGTLQNLKKEDIEGIRIKELQERISARKIGVPGTELKEIILAINPTTEGEATALYLERTLKAFQIKITRLGRGLPIGGELEFADDETLGSSLEGRK
ncbi:MAG: recombination mediator RecR [Candidatus Nealsonbacteria bacterium]